MTIAAQVCALNVAWRNAEPKARHVFWNSISDGVCRYGASSADRDRVQFQQFLDHCIEAFPGSRLQITKAHDAYNAWARVIEARPMSCTAFAIQIAKHGYRSKKSSVVFLLDVRFSMREPTVARAAIAAVRAMAPKWEDDRSRREGCAGGSTA